VFTRRSVPYPLLETFDMANAQQAHSKRDVTTTPLQALTLINNDTVFSGRKPRGPVIAEAGPDEGAQINRLYQILFSRNPSDDEGRSSRCSLDSHEKVRRGSRGGWQADHRRSVGKGLKVADRFGPRPLSISSTPSRTPTSLSTASETRKPNVKKETTS